MSIDDYEVMEHRLGYKHEYWDGFARLSPNPCAIAEMSLGVSRFLEIRTKRSASPIGSGHCTGVGLDDRSELIALFERAFDDNAEYCGYDENAYRMAAVRSIDRCLFVGGQLNPDLRYSRLVRYQGEPLGALLVTTDRERKVIGPLMVDPNRWRSGVATLLLQETCKQLASDSVETVYSNCHLANGPSLAWHEAMGFSRHLSWLAAAHLRRHHQQNARYNRHHGHEAVASLHEELSENYRQLHDLLYERDSAENRRGATEANP